MQVRILCGAYELASPFIEGGCAHEWVDCLDEPGYPLRCPGCGQYCHAELAECARLMLEKRVVFVFGCPHHAFTFSRRERKPYFAPDVTNEESRDAGGSEEAK